MADRRRILGEDVSDGRFNKTAQILKKKNQNSKVLLNCHEAREMHVNLLFVFEVFCWVFNLCEK